MDMAKGNWKQNKAGEKTAATLDFLLLQRETRHAQWQVRKLFMLTVGIRSRNCKLQNYSSLIIISSL